MPRWRFVSLGLPLDCYRHPHPRSRSSGLRVHSVGPWSGPDAIIVPDPYEGNAFDFDKAFADKKVKAAIFRAAQGLTVDTAVMLAPKEAKRRGIPFGIYLLGMSAQPWRDSKGKLQAGQDPIAQADLLVKSAGETGANMLALDIEA